MTKKEDDKAQQGKSRSYSRFEECIMLLIAKFFSKEKDINKFGEWLEKYLKEGDDLTKEETIKWNKQSEKDLYDEKLDEQYYVDDIEYWVLLEKN